MAKTESKQIALHTKAPYFNLLNAVTNDYNSLDDLRGSHGTVIMFLCNHCPFVKHVNEELVRTANDYRVLGFGFIAISSNDVAAYPQDGPKQMHQTAREHHYSFPYLYDESQETAKAYQAVCTPDFYLYDADLELVYHGQLDNSRPNNGSPSNGRDLREALDNLFNNRPPVKPQKPSIGCSIKWKRP